MQLNVYLFIYFFTSISRPAIRPDHAQQEAHELAQLAGQLKARRLKPRNRARGGQICRARRLARR